MPTIFRRQCGC